MKSKILIAKDKQSIFGTNTAVVKIRNSEKVVSEATPLGADQEPDSGYRFTHWTADKDLVASGETIAKGQQISMELQRLVIPQQDF